MSEKLISMTSLNQAAKKQRVSPVESEHSAIAKLACAARARGEDRTCPNPL